MSQPKTYPVIKDGEFIALMALLMSLMALAIDAIMPAMAIIGQSLNVQDANDNQLLISSIFLGMALGLMLYGPISDAYGRKSAIYLGVGIFLLGNIISITANDFQWMLIGRLAQGFGAASCRVITTAIIRDRFDGAQMAKFMSLVMLVFILIPTLAPAIGQLILYVAPWQGIFIMMMSAALVGVIWLWLRQDETLANGNRIPLSFKNVWAGIKETIQHPVSRAYTLAAGFMFGAFIGYLSSAQQILQFQYELGEAFTLYFGALAFGIGISSYANSKLVMRFSMHKLCMLALSIILVCAIIFSVISISYDGHPPLIILITYLALTFFCAGILFGNFNTLALHPLGHIAGVANSVISTGQTFISVAVGAYIGSQYDGSVLPLTYGFLGTSIITWLIVWRVGKHPAHIH